MQLGIINFHCTQLEIKCHETEVKLIKTKISSLTTCCKSMSSILLFKAWDNIGVANLISKQKLKRMPNIFSLNTN